MMNSKDAMSKSDLQAEEGASVDKRKSLYGIEPNVRSASFSLSTFNMVNALLGTGILGLPYAMGQLGIFLFFLFAVCIVSVALFTIYLLLKMCEQTGVKEYEKIGFSAFGLSGRVIAALCIIGNNIGSISSYLLVIKYELPNVILSLMDETKSDGSWYYNGSILVIIVTCAVIVPLSSLTNIGFLGYTSGFSILCMVFFVITVIFKKFTTPCPLLSEGIIDNLTLFEAENFTAYMEESFSGFGSGDLISNASGADFHYFNGSVPNFHLGHEEQQCDAAVFEFTDKWVYGLPTIIFAFSGHVGVLPIYAELKSPSTSRMQTVAFSAFTTCFTLYSLSAVFGYLTFYNWLEPELLLTYNLTDQSNLLTLLVRICVLLTVIVTVPVNHFSMRKAINFILFPKKNFSWFRHIGIMLVSLAMILCFVIFVTNIREVYGIVGATTSNMVTFILPCVFFLKLDNSRLKSPLKIAAISICVVGSGIMVQTLCIIILGYF
ncbi:sodium-coupled neutral amino acid transporter 4-like [Styela clava]